MKLRLTARLRAALTAAVLSFASSAQPFALAKGSVLVPLEEADVAKGKSSLSTPTLGEKSAYTLSEAAETQTNVLNITKYTWEETPFTLTPVVYNVLIKSMVNLDDVNHSFNWMEDDNTEKLTLVDESPYSESADVLSSNTFTSRVNSLTDNVSRNFVGISYDVIQIVDDPLLDGVNQGGGALTLLDTSLTDLTITGHFIGNAVSVSVSSFIDNNQASGGAIYSLASISSITGDFIGNSASASASTTSSDHTNATALGGAIYSSATIGEIRGDFIHNSVTSTEIGKGGAIHNNQIIKHITGDFINNSAQIYNDSLTINPTMFIFSVAQGGAIYNAATIGSITGDFINNSVTTTLKNSAEKPIVPATNGGALYNEGTIESITGNFINNSASVFSDKLKRKVFGGAIYNLGNAKIGLLAHSSSILFTGNYTNNNGLITSNAIYNLTKSQKDAIINFDAYGLYQIIVNDEIDGMDGGFANQILNINKGSTTISDTNFSTITFNNKVANQTINVFNGTLLLSAFEGITLANGMTISKAHALLEDSKINIKAGATLATNTEYIADSSSITNEGTIALTGGTFTREFEGAISIIGEVSAEANIIDSTDISLASTGTLALTDGELKKGLAGMGKLKIANSSVAFGQNNSHTGGTIIASGVNYSLSNEGILGTGSLTLESGSVLSLQGVSLARSTSLQWDGQSNATQLDLDSSSSFTLPADTHLSLVTTGISDDFNWTFLTYEEGATLPSLNEIKDKVLINGHSYSDDVSQYYTLSQQNQAYVLNFNADFEALDFSEQTVTQTDIDGENLHLANFSKATAQNLNFEDKELVLANFSDANLQGSNFSNAYLSANTWQGADLRGVTFNERLPLATPSNYVDPQGVLQVENRLLTTAQTIYKAAEGQDAVQVAKNLNIGQGGALNLKHDAQLRVTQNSELTLDGGRISMYGQHHNSLTKIIIESGSSLNIKNGGIELTLATVYSLNDWTWEFLIWEDASAALSNNELEAMIRINGNRISDYSLYLQKSNSGASVSLTNVKPPGPDSYTQMQNSRNGREGGKMLDAVIQQGGTPSPDIQDVLDTLNDIFIVGDPVTAESDRLLSAIAGAGVTSLGSAALSNIEGQLMRMRNRAGGFMPAGESHFWISAEAGRNKLEGEGSASGHSIDNWGGSVGAEWGLGESTSLGFAFTALYGDLNASSVDAAEGDLDSYYLSLVAQHQSGNWQHHAFMSWGLTDANLDRHVSHANGSYSTSGDTDGYSFGIMYELGYDIKLSESSTLTPLLNAALVHSYLDGYTETGSDTALNVGEQDNTIATFGVGARFESKLDIGMQIGARALLKIDAGDRAQEADVSFANVAASHARIEGSEAGPVGIELGFGVSMPVSENSALFLDASADLREDQQNSSASMGYHMSF